MHNCRQTNKKLIDLVFGEMETVEQQRALAEIRSCTDCSEQYQLMLASLNAFDQVADAEMPDESYWTGYEARLRARLAEAAQPKRQERLTGWFAELLAKPSIPMAAVASLALLIAVSVFWLIRQRQTDPRQIVAEATPSPLASPSSLTSEPKTTEKEPVAAPQTTVAEKRTQRRHRRVINKPEVEASQAIQNDAVAANFPQVNYAPVTLPELPTSPTPAAHFEKAQLLLRTFRNAQFDNDLTAFDLPYEKQRANKLIYDNILLRREAEAKGYLPFEEALTSLEPLLLDIANLPDKPSQYEMQAIKERIQKQEIIATLNVVSSGADRFNSPIRFNR
ncbi:MAG: hypothetical protein AB7P14_25035 [Blastocatellales bacterium]